MNDVWSFDFVNLTWNSIACRAETETPNSPLPPIAGHTIVQWQDALLVVGGHVKVTVLVLCFVFLRAFSRKI